MNKYITMLLLGVVIIAMALVLGIYMQHVSDEENIPPVSSANSASSQAHSGNSAPAIVTTGSATSSAPGTGTTSADSSVRLNLGQPTAPGIQAPAGMTLTERQNTADSSGQASGQTSGQVFGQTSGQSASQSMAQNNSPAATQVTAPNPAATGASGSSAPAPTTTVRPTATPATNPTQAGQTTSAQVAGRPSSTPAAGQAVTQPQAKPAQAKPATSGTTASVSQGHGNILQTTLKFRGLGMFLSIEADSPLPAKHFVLASPDRLVIDLPGAWKNLKLPAVPSNMLIKDIRIGRQADADRIVIDLSRKIKNDSMIRINDKKVEIFFE